jgi:hypothetical protein
MNFKHNDVQRKKFLPKPKYRHPENDNSSVSREGPRQNNEQNVTENEVPKCKKSLKGEILSLHSEHELDDTTEMKSDGGTKIKSNILHVGNEDSLKNSHSSDQIYQSNEASNGKKLIFFVVNCIVTVLQKETKSATNCLV